jgi:molybdate transport system substrate-binding protein
MREFFRLVVAVLAVPLLARAARADDLLVLSAAAARQALAPAPGWFEKSTGSHVRFVFGTAGEMRAKALSSAPFDIIIAPPAILADLVRRDAVAAGSRKDLGAVVLAAAVRKGAPHPDISNEGALRATLLATPAIGIADPAIGATSGIYLMKLMQRLGIAAAIKSKMKLYPDGSDAMKALARGEIALGLGQKSEIIPVPGVDLVGSLPQTVQLRTIYAAGLAKQSEGKRSAGELLEFLSGPQMLASFRANGFDPPQ